MAKQYNEYHKNPRKISKPAKALLEESMERVGDLSGIVHNLETDEIISGNQRCKVINIKECEIEIVKKLKRKNKRGTVAYGYALWKGIPFNYRQVKWDEATAEFANLAANKLGGEWDKRLFKKFDKATLLKAGFKRKDVFNAKRDAFLKNSETEFPFVKELDYASNYVVLMFDKDIDWLWVKEVLGIGSAWRRYANGKLHTKGVGRVVDGMEAIKKIQEAKDEN